MSVKLVAKIDELIAALRAEREALAKPVLPSPVTAELFVEDMHNQCLLSFKCTFERLRTHYWLTYRVEDSANYTGTATRAFTRAQGRLTEIPLDVLPLDTLTMCCGTGSVAFPPLSIRLTPAQLGLAEVTP